MTFLRYLEYDIPELGKIKHALYRCDDCHDDYMIDNPTSWTTQCSENYCHRCFTKHPGEIPLIMKLQ